jgi:hypothetical protein
MAEKDHTGNLNLNEDKVCILHIFKLLYNTIKDEIATLEAFILQDGGLYSFKEKRHHELFTHLLTKRLYDEQWLAQAGKTHILVILQAIRLLTRDKTILVYLNLYALE